MSGIVSLSYALSNNTAYYGGSRLNLESRVKETGNKFTRETNLCFSSHSGTHLDFPSHFYRDGKKGNDYPLDFFIFHRAAVVECNLLDADGKIDGSLMKGFALEQGLELILVKTHFCSIRGQERIWKDSPVVSADFARDLRAGFPKLRMIGFDLISVTSQRDKEEGRRAHLGFLDESGGREILLLEDADLNVVSRETMFQKVIVAPLFFEKMEGAPCTVIAEIS